MDWLKSIAPLIGTALGGPFGALAASFLADKLGVEEKTVDAVTRALSEGKMTPEMVVQIKLAEIDFQKFTEQNKITLEQLDVENTRSARDMQITTKSTTPAILTYLITCGFFGILGYMMSADYQSSDPLLVMLGSLGTAWVATVNFWFGSSNGSRQKTELLARADAIK